jgi:hypothetical protein
LSFAVRQEFDTTACLNSKAKSLNLVRNAAVKMTRRRGFVLKTHSNFLISHSITHAMVVLNFCKIPFNFNVISKTRPLITGRA